MQDRFKQLLKDKRLTAAQFATLIKVNPSAMSHILNGRSKPGFDVLDKIGQTFPDINLNWLVSGKGAPYTDSKESDEIGADPQETVTSISQKTSPIASQTLSEIESEPATVAEIAVPQHSKIIKRIVLFFNDGSFEVYEK